MLGRLRERLRSARARRPAVDHAVRAYDRHSGVQGGQVAAAITFYGFLSFFPLVALAFSVVGYVSVVFPDARDAITHAVEDAFPSLVGTGKGQINIDDVVAAKTSAGIFGLLGLLYAGLGWIDALRVGLRRLFGTAHEALPLLRQKSGDVLVLLLLGVTVLASAVVSTLATEATSYVLGLAGLEHSLLAVVLLRVVAVVLALVLDAALLAILFTRLPGVRLSWRQLRSGALLGAAGLGVLKLFGSYLLARTTNNPVYATFGVIVGLLVWINLMSRLVMYAAAWTVTQPYSLLPGSVGEPGVGRSTGLASATEPVSAVAPADYDVVPVTVESAGGSSRRTRTLRGFAVGAAVGAVIAGVLGRRRGARD